MRGSRMRRADVRSFTATLLAAVILAAIVAAAIAPLVAWPLGVAGFRFPFPRICDRVVMVTITIALLAVARPLRLGELLREGFARTPQSAREFGAGLGLAIAVVLLLEILGTISLGRSFPVWAVARRAAHFALAALFIAIIEEGFFRAILMGGMTRDFGSRGALVGSSVIYAFAHLIRSPKHYLLLGLHPAAGFHNLAASLSRLIHPGELIAMLFGLFLLGLVLGQAYRVSGGVYLGIGLHAGVILGAKTWGAVVAGRAIVPQWLAGAGPVPLIAAPAAWLCSLVLLIIVTRWPRQLSYSFGIPRTGRVL